MKKSFFSLSIVVLMSFFVIGLTTTAVFADGTETLGPPIGIDIQPGSGIVVGGTGLNETQPADISINVPGDVVQALIYWECESPTVAAGNDDTITVNGSDVTGIKIGGGPDPVRDDSFITLYAQTFRADITGLVGTGDNTLWIGGLDCGETTAGPLNNGAGVLVIFDDGSASDIEIFDGNDFAWCQLPSPYDTTIPQTFSFAPADYLRIGKLSLFVSSISGASSGGGFRPSRIDLTIDGTSFSLDGTFPDFLNSVDGDEWDTVRIGVPISEGASELTVEMVSPSEFPNCASFVWNTAALSISDAEGCTPGYWRQEQHFGSWTGYGQAMPFSEAFDCNIPITGRLIPGTGGPPVTITNPTLLQAVWAIGGGENALARHGVAALLNASNLAVDYPRSADQVKSMVCNALLPGGDIEGTKNILAGFNEGDESDDYCPLGRAELDGLESSSDSKKGKKKK